MNPKYEAAIKQLDETRTKSGVDIGGKKYSMVKDRVELFRKHWGDEYGINTDVDYSAGFQPGSVVVAVAKIVKGDTTLASGHAMVAVGQDDVSSTSPVEAAETAAIGRALASFGLHGGEFASGDEMRNKGFVAQPNSLQMGEQMFRESLVQQEIDEKGLFQPTPPPEQVKSALFVPNMNEEFDIESMTDVVLGELLTVNDKRKLSMYWDELKPFVARLSQERPDKFAEVKAAFATTSAILKRT